MMVIYWFPARFYVEHLLFFVHNHAFVFLFFSVLWLASLLAPESVMDVLAPVACCYIPVYLFLSMRRVYGQGRLLTLTKFVVLSFAYLFFSVLMLVLISVYSVLTA
jgi:hypothetical protein